jgi:hypothetical protein
MLTRLSSAFLTTALLVAADPETSALWSKPPDLPIDTKDTFEPGVDAPVTRSKICPGENAADTKPLLVDVLMRFFDAMYSAMSTSDNLGIETQSVDKGAQEQAIRFSPPVATVGIGGPAPPAAACNSLETIAGQRQAHYQHQLMAAARLYTIGDHCVNAGDWAMARNCFEEVTRVCPNCDFALLASIKLAQIDSQRAPAESGTEEQKAPPMVEGQPDLILENRASLRRIHESRRMFEKGERYEAAGKFDKAYGCYQEARAVCPACHYGQQALERMILLETRRSAGRKRGGAEEQEPPLRHRRHSFIEGSLQRYHSVRGLYRLTTQRNRRADQSVAGIVGAEEQSEPPLRFRRYGAGSLQRHHALRGFYLLGERNRRLGGASIFGAEEQQETPARHRRQRLTEIDMDRRMQARSLYLLGERCRRGGDLRMAAAFYEECFGTCPGSYYTVRANERLRQIEARQRQQPRWEGAETQEPRDRLPIGMQTRRWAACFRDLFEMERGPGNGWIRDTGGLEQCRRRR